MGRDSIRDWLKEHSDKSDYFLDCLDLGWIADDLVTVSSRYRNGLAHRGAADRKKAAAAMNFIFGQFDANRLTQRGILIRVLDRLIDYDKQYG